MVPSPKTEQRWALASLVACLSSALCLAASPSPSRAGEAGVVPIEIRGRWLAGAGLVHRGGRLCLRALDSERVALAVTLPSLPLLAERQYLLREGEALLSWATPAGAREPVPAAGPWRELLELLPPAAWGALLAGDGRVLAGCLEAAVAGEEDGWPVLRGRLAGGSATLRLRGARAWRLTWELPAGTLRCHWQDGPRGAGSQLRLQLPDGLWLRAVSRLARRPELSPEDWLFLDAAGNRLQDSAF